VEMRAHNCIDHGRRADSVDREGMERLAVAVQTRLYPFVSTAVRDHHATEDVLQDVILVVVEQVHRLRRPDRFWSWVYRIAWSKVQDHFRGEQRSRRMGKLCADDVQCQAPQRLGSDALETMLRKEAMDQFGVAMRQLNDRGRVVLYLRFYEQMPYAQIASLMHSTPGQVRMQFHRAKRKLRDSMVASCA
jgi:RNA polymerase sigma-70 factor (ECF subfamily)